MIRRTTMISAAVLLAGVLFEGARGGSAFAHITPETEEEHQIGVRMLPVEGRNDKYRIVVPWSGELDESRNCFLIVCSHPVPAERQDFRSYIWNEDRSREDVLLVAPLLTRGFGQSQYVECMLDDFLMTRSYLFVDAKGPMADGGYYYSIDLSTYPLPGAPQMSLRYSPAGSVGPEKGVMRRDPSDIIRTRDVQYQGNILKTRDTYYVWYTKSYVSHGYDATVWYATSTDGHTWVEQGEALPRGPEGSWDAQSVFTPNILRVKRKYYLFYTGVPKPFNNKGNKVTKSAIGIAVSDAPDGPWEKLSANPVLTCSDDPSRFDSMRVDDACLLVRNGKYWLYYKGRQWNNTPANTMTGVAIAERPEGPYEKYVGNPVIRGGHEVLVWPLQRGVVAMVNIGPEGIRKTLQYAPDGLTFSRMVNPDAVPRAPGAYRPRAFWDRSDGRMIEWGLHIGQKEGFLPFLERFDCHWE